jgi:hypothetical protein
MRGIIFIFLFSVSCGDLVETLPQAKGKNSEIIFVVNDDLWYHSLDSLVNTIFGATIKGLNQ